MAPLPPPALLGPRAPAAPPAQSPAITPPASRDDARASLASASTQYIYGAPAPWVLLGIGGCVLLIRAVGRYRLRRAREQQQQQERNAGDANNDDKFCNESDCDCGEDCRRGAGKSKRRSSGGDFGELKDRRAGDDWRRDEHGRNWETKIRGDDKMATLNNNTTPAEWPRTPPPPPLPTLHDTPSPSRSPSRSGTGKHPATDAQRGPPPPPLPQEEQFLDGPAYTWQEDAEAAASAEVSIADIAERTRRRSYTKNTGGVEVVGEVVVGEGWRRHTRVYGGGVCLACLESERVREGMGMGVAVGGGAETAA